MNIRKIALLLELLITIILWSGIIAIPYLEYDDNYAVLFYGLVFSIITFGLFIGYYGIKNALFFKGKWEIYCFLFHKFK